MCLSVHMSDVATLTSRLNSRAISETQCEIRRANGPCVSRARTHTHTHAQTHTQTHTHTHVQVEILSEIRHPNVVLLMGACLRGPNLVSSKYGYVNTCIHGSKHGYANTCEWGRACGARTWYARIHVSMLACMDGYMNGCGANNGGVLVGVPLG